MSDKESSVAGSRRCSARLLLFKWLQHRRGRRRRTYRLGRPLFRNCTRFRQRTRVRQCARLSAGAWPTLGLRLRRDGCSPRRRPGGCPRLGLLDRRSGGLLRDIGGRPFGLGLSGRARARLASANARQIIGHRGSLIGAGGVVRTQEARARAPKLARAAMAACASISKNLRRRFAGIDIALSIGRRDLQTDCSEAGHRP